MKTLKSILAEIANKEFKDNLFAWVIARYFENIDKKDKESFYESLAVYYKKHIDEKEFPNLDETLSEINLETLPQDLRIKSIIINSVRGIPDKVHEIPFGLELSDNDEVINAIILGPNSSGKSSLFSAVEYIFSKRVGEADLRTNSIYEDGDEYYFDYLRHFSSIPECSINTLSGQFDLRNSPFQDDYLRHLINPNNYFISDFDIYEKGRKNYLGEPENENSFHYLIASSLGLQDFLNFQNLIYNLTTYRRSKESNQLSKLNKEKKELETNIKNWETEIKKRQEETLIIESNSQSQQLDEIQKRNNENIVLCQSLSQFDYSISFDIETLKLHLNIFKLVYSELKTIPSDRIDEIEAQFFTLGLDLIKKTVYNNCPFCNASKKDFQTIKQEVNTKLKLYEDYSQKLLDLKNSFNIIIQYLKDFSLFLLSNSRRATNELELLKTRSEFINIYNSLNDLYHQLNNSPTISILEGYEYNTQFSLKNAEVLNNSLLLKIRINKIEEFLSKINQFSIFRKAEIDSILIKLRSNQTISSDQEKLVILRNDIVKFSDQIKQAQNRIKTINDDIPFQEDAVKLVNEIKEKAKAYQKIISLKITEAINTVFEPIQQTICEILADYVDDNNISIKVFKDIQLTEDREILSETLKVALIKIDKTEENQITPNKYFNTFRYRLFCLMVSCSIAIATRRLTGINIPFVIDDLFYASDYVNRSTIVTFLQKLISLFNIYSPKGMETQFIIFTHDEMIFDCAVEAIQDCNNDISVINKHPREKIKYYRLHDFSFKIDIPEIKKGLKFWNIAQEIPSKVESFYDLIK